MPQHRFTRCAGSEAACYVPFRTKDVLVSGEQAGVSRIACARTRVCTSNLDRPRSTALTSSGSGSHCVAYYHRASRLPSSCWRQRAAFKLGSTGVIWSLDHSLPCPAACRPSKQTHFVRRRRERLRLAACQSTDRLLLVEIDGLPIRWS